MTSRFVKLTQRYQNDPYVLNGTFVIRLVFPQNTVLNYTSLHLSQHILSISTPCLDETHYQKGANCRTQVGFETYVKDFPDFPWTFKANDDTFIDMKNLLRLIHAIEERGDPKRYLFFAGFRQVERTVLAFPHGGCGWLLSYAFVAFQVSRPELSMLRLYDYSRYRQDDTTQEIVLRYIFGSSDWSWDATALTGFPLYPGYPLWAFKEGNWSFLPRCKPHCNDETDLDANGKARPIGTGHYGRVRDYVAQHSVGMNPDNVELWEMHTKAPKEVYMWQDRWPNYMKLCYSETTPIGYYGTDREYWKGLKLLTAEDMKDPLIDFNTIIDADRVNL